MFSFWKSGTSKFGCSQPVANCVMSYELRCALVLGDELAVDDGHVELVGFVEVYRGVRLLDDLGVDLLYFDVVRVPVVLVLDHDHPAGRVELGQLVGAIVEQRIRAEGILVTL